jgi:hypothetical protein
MHYFGRRKEGRNVLEAELTNNEFINEWKIYFKRK